MIIRQVKFVKHLLPERDAHKHCTNDGVYCACSPTATVDETDDGHPVTVKHTSLMRRMYGRAGA